MGEIIRLENIDKHFGDVYANKNICLSVKEGTVHSIVGENGAGKSTLMNILYGMVSPDSGKIFINNQEVTIGSPKDAISMGIGMVHQHFMLVPSLTVMENITLGLPPHKERIWRPEKFRSEISKLMSDFGLDVNLNARVQDIPVGMKQRVEILKVLYRGAKIIILDEPTAILTPQETQELFTTIKMLVNEGHTVIFISHKLKEVMSVSDEISALRDGQLINTVSKNDVTIDDVAYMMIGRNLEPIAKETNYTDDVCLELQNASAKASGFDKPISDFSFALRHGEILGIAGVEGNGQETLVDAIVGATHLSGGDILFNGCSVINDSIKVRMEKGIAHIPEDRMTQGLALDVSVAKNVILGIHDKAPIYQKLKINWKAVSSLAQKLIESFSIKVKGANEDVKNLSGGNMQKVVVARELNRDPALIIACQPTRGVDIGSSKYIRECLIDAKKKGGSILLVSADLDEIMELSDRILVIYDGHIAGILDAAEATEYKLGQLMFGKEVHSA